MSEPTILIALVLAVAIAAYVALVRPWMLAWGSTKAERSEPLPGDDVMPNARYVTTRAVTIDGQPEHIWPWLVQMGQDRAGFYTHNWVERLFAALVYEPLHAYMETGLMRGLKERAERAPVGSAARAD